MNNNVKKEWGLTALKECDQRAIEGGYVQPTSENAPGYEEPKGFIRIVTVFWGL